MNLGSYHAIRAEHDLTLAVLNPVKEAGAPVPVFIAPGMLNRLFPKT